jgi:hypothetical protein
MSAAVAIGLAIFVIGTIWMDRRERRRAQDRRSAPRAPGDHVVSNMRRRGG